MLGSIWIRGIGGDKVKQLLSEYGAIIGSALGLYIVTVLMFIEKKSFLRYFLIGLGILMILIVFLLLIV